MSAYTPDDMQWARDFRARESELADSSPVVRQSGSSEGASAAPRRCISCGKPLLPRSLNTRFDIDYHKVCWVMSEERQELSRLMAAVEDDSDPFAGLIEKVQR